MIQCILLDYRTPLCRPHKCSHCGSKIDDLATHGRKGRHPSHGAVNNIILEQVQLRAARIFLGVGWRHTRLALQYEMIMLLLVWEARRCVEFWVRMMRMEEKRIVRMVALEAWECQRKVKWVEELEDSLEKFGWSSGVVEKLESVSLGEVGHILKDCAWCKVKKGMDD